MLKTRVIPCVLLKNWQLVKSINFNTYRTIGHPVVTVRVYNARNVDELIVLDIDASNNGEEINLELIADMAEECFMPLTVGGGIKSIDDIRKVLNAGADKIAINSAALNNIDFITEASRVFGSQCIVVSIDVKKDLEGKYRVFNKKSGTIEVDPIAYAKKCESAGAGEILLTSVDNEGTQQGYDLELVRHVSRQVSIPVIANGGAGEPLHCAEAVNNGANAVAAAYIFHFSKYTPDMIKMEMNKSGIPTREFKGFL